MNRASIFALFFVLILSSMVSAQDDQQQIWYGVLDVGVAKLRLEIRVTKSPDGNYTGSMISRDQGNADMKFDSFKIKDGVMTFEIKAVKASYEGRLDATGNVVNGTFTQFGNENELKFERKTQTAVPKHVETWQGNMEAGPREFEFQLRVFESIDGKRSALLDSFSENLPNIPVELDETEGFNFEVPGTRATYEGNLSEDRKTITGHWLQSGGKFELNFSAIPVSQTRYVNVNRPQTPEPPFDYESIEVCVKSTTDPDVTLAGTLTLPKGDGTFPAAILISGSGPQDRDCTIFGHKSFLVIADHFAKNGIAVLRYDERGIGESTGKFADATSEDLAADVEDLLNWLKNHSGVDTQKLVLIGHSEGGIIAPMIASRREDLATIIVLAGPTVTGEKIVMNQTRKIAAVAGAEELFLDGQDALMKRVIDQLGKGKLGAKYVNGVAVAANECDQVLVSWNRQVNDAASRSMNVEARIMNLDGSFEGASFRVNRHSEGRHRLTAASGKQRIVWTNEQMFFAWNGSNDADKSAANLTVRTSGSGKYDLKTPVKTAVAGRDVDQTVTARPHEPPTYDPRRVSREASGGDPNPVPGPGMDFGFIGMTNTGWNPPDPSLAVGPAHLVGMTNGEIAFFDKNGNVTFSDEIENSFGFWGSLGTDNFVFDPEVIFDPHSQRFIAMACERSDNNRSNFLLAISDDDNPNGNWNKYRLDVTSLAGNDIDSPNLGVDDQAVYLTADFFGPDKYLIYMLDKTDLISGTPNPLARSLLVTGSQSFGIPVMYDAGAPAFYMIQAFEFGTYSTVRMHAVTDPLGSPSRFNTDVSVPSYGHPQDPPQQGTSTRPELFEARFWSCVYRDGSLWAVHHQSPNSSGTVRARWYQFDMNGWPTSGNFPFLVQSGDIFPGAGIHTFFPSIWVDGLGNAAITCARSGVNEFISMCRTVRQPVDPAGTFQTLEFVRQSNSQFNSNRWGDYSGTMNDPSAPGTFWGMHEYTPGGNSWNTWIGQYVIESVTDVPVESYEVIRGNEVAGDIDSLVESDDDFLEALPGLTLNESEPPIWIEFETTSPANQPVDLIFALEARVNTPNVEQVIEVFDFDAGSYLQVDARPATIADSVVQIPLPANVTRFADTDGTMRARVGWAQDGLVLFFPWKASIDHVFWTVTE